MSLYERYVLPQLISMSCSCNPVRMQREKVVPQASGAVVELGFGSGLNLPYYDARKVTGLCAIEPAKGMRARARKAIRRAPFPVEMMSVSAERLSLPVASVDTVLVTYSLCTIADAVTALERARTALKPNGRLLFCEHGIAPDPSVRRWQRPIEPVWRVVGGGCHLTRDIPEIIRSAGFEIEQLGTMYLPRTPKWSGFNYWGAARPRS